MGGKVRVAIVGVGNCANAFLQGLTFYAGADDPMVGLVRPWIGPYSIDDIEVVAAFDVAEGKVYEQIGVAAQAFPNATYDFGMFPTSTVIVSRGPTMDGLGESMRKLVKESSVLDDDVLQVLKDSGATVVVNYLPVGSQLATEFYADAAIKAGCAFVNCIPVFLASTREWEDRFLKARLPIIGDDIKSQVGATIVHRAIATLMRSRGVKLKRTMQLNVGGNGDFMNMLDRSRLESKKTSKTQSVVAVAGDSLDVDGVHIGPSDYVQWLGDRKWAYIRLEAEGFGGSPMAIELKLEVWDSPNSAGIVIDAVRCAQAALDKGLAGTLLAPSANFMKSPPAFVRQWDDSYALDQLDSWLFGVV